MCVVIKMSAASSHLQKQVGDDAGKAAADAASTPVKRSTRTRLPKLNATAVLRERSVSDDGSSSNESCVAVVDEPAGETEVAAGSGWIFELPGLLSSADTENDDDDDPVYSLKPLFAGWLEKRKARCKIVWALQRVRGLWKNVVTFL